MLDNQMVSALGGKQPSVADMWSGSLRSDLQWDKMLNDELNRMVQENEEKRMYDIEMRDRKKNLNEAIMTILPFIGGGLGGLIGGPPGVYAGSSLGGVLGPIIGVQEPRVRKPIMPKR